MGSRGIPGDGRRPGALRLLPALLSLCALTLFRTPEAALAQNEPIALEPISVLPVEGPEFNQP